MFTGLITAIGTVREIRRNADLRIVIACPWDPQQIAIGASVACSGACLTIVDKGGQPGDGWFAVDVSAETLSCTSPARWDVGAKLNLEPALKLGEELGGHIVTGHVDGLGTVASVTPVGDSQRVEIAAPAALAPYIAPKGSITVDGTSLTVNEVTDEADGACRFSLNIIPHTAAVTTLGALVPGEAVNLEIDVLARYLKRMQSLQI